MNPKITMGNDEFILYIRKQHPNCQISTKDLGRYIWEWIIEHDHNAKQVEEDLPCLWATNNGAKNIDEMKLPKTATQFEFNRNLLPELYCHLDELGSNFNKPMTLHEAIIRLLMQSGRPMSTKEIARELNLNKWYVKKDKSEITDFQIHGRTKNYPQFFLREGSMVSLKNDLN